MLSNIKTPSLPPPQPQEIVNNTVKDTFHISYQRNQNESTAKE